MDFRTAAHHGYFPTVATPIAPPAAPIETAARGVLRAIERFTTSTTALAQYLHNMQPQQSSQQPQYQFGNSAHAGGGAGGAADSYGRSLQSDPYQFYHQSVRSLGGGGGGAGVELLPNGGDYQRTSANARTVAGAITPGGVLGGHASAAGSGLPNALNALAFGGSGGSSTTAALGQALQIALGDRIADAARTIVSEAEATAAALELVVAGRVEAACELLRCWMTQSARAVAATHMFDRDALAANFGGSPGAATASTTYGVRVLYDRLVATGVVAMQLAAAAASAGGNTGGTTTAAYGQRQSQSHSQSTRRPPGRNGSISSAAAAGPNGGGAAGVGGDNNNMGVLDATAATYHQQNPLHHHHHQQASEDDDAGTVHGMSGNTAGVAPQSPSLPLHAVSSERVAMLANFLAW
jgi:hypothetical protein